MRSSLGGTRRRRIDARTLAAAGALACVAPGCPGVFTGPYPCESGFASCINPQSDMCETDITSDALNCGACGTACGLGAVCASSVCGTPAMQLAALGQSAGQQTTLEVNATAVFWNGIPNGQAGVFSVPVAGGSVATVATDVTCEGRHSFAVDDKNIYYVSTGNGAGFGPGSPGNNGGLVALPLLGGAPTVLVPASNGWTYNGCPVMAVDATNVYALVRVAQPGAQSVTTLQDVPIAGGPTTTLGMSSSYSSSELVVTATDAIVQVQNNNGPGSYAAIPVAGGSPVAVPVSANVPGGSAFAADATNIYVLGSECSCNGGNGSNNNGGNNNGGNGNSPDSLPTGQVVVLPIDGGPATTLARFTGLASSIAIDSANVYFSTDTAVWKVPIGGNQSQVSVVAGNLTGGAPAYKCNGGSGCGSPGSVINVIAVDATSVYIADIAPTVGAILKVPK